MANYIGDNPQFILNGFIHAGTAKALNGEDIDNPSASEAIASTTSEESDDDEDDTHIDLRNCITSQYHLLNMYYVTM